MEHSSLAVAFLALDMLWNLACLIILPWEALSFGISKFICGSPLRRNCSVVQLSLQMAEDKDVPPWLHKVNPHNQLPVLLLLMETSRVLYSISCWFGCPAVATKGTKRFFPVLLLFPSRPQQVELFTVHRAHHELYLKRSL